MSSLDLETGAAAAEIGDPAAAACAVCPHSPESHDVIARRLCTATQAGGFHRGCVCTGASDAAVTTAMRVAK